MYIVLINLLVDDAGAETTITALVPFKAPSLEPSVNALPVSSEYAVTYVGFVVVAAPDIATEIDLVVASKTNIIALYLEMNQEYAYALDWLEVDAIVIEPLAFVMVILLPAVKVALVNPVPLPMSIWPFAGVVVNPVPPLETPNVPAKVTAPEVAVLGVNPLKDVWNVVTPVAGGADHDAVVPFDVNT